MPECGRIRKKRGDPRRAWHWGTKAMRAKASRPRKVVAPGRQAKGTELNGGSSGSVAKGGGSVMTEVGFGVKIVSNVDPGV